MDRIERTELFGQHVICATAYRTLRKGVSRGWEVQVSAMELGAKPDTPLLRFPVDRQDHADPDGAVDTALRVARRHLSVALANASRAVNRTGVAPGRSSRSSVRVLRPRESR